LLRNNPEERSSHLRRGGSMKSRTHTKVNEYELYFKHITNRLVSAA